MKDMPITILAVLLVFATGTRARAGELPSEPLEIGHDSQFDFDLHVVDTTWGLKSKG